MQELATLKLKKDEDRRLRSGHLWIFSNEIDVEASPLKGFAKGQLARIESHKNEFIGIGYVNPESLITARLLSRSPSCKPNADFFKHRLKQALSLRETYYDKPYYRLVYGESDGLPGLIVDRFGDVFAVQINTAGMDSLLDSLLEAIISTFDPKAIVLRNSSGLRTLEGIETYDKVVFGHLDGVVEIFENGSKFHIDPLAGQKTGWFFDHRENRRLLAGLCQGKEVLDLFSYSGAWTIPCAQNSARVTSVDASQSAIDLLRASAQLNDVESAVDPICADVFDFLKDAREKKQKFDVVIVDPPAFIKRKKDLRKGLEGYRRLNQMALQVLNKNGLLVSASCSYHLREDDLLDVLRSSARHMDRDLVVTAKRGAGPDHPIHPAIPETSYLKALFCQVRSTL
jgi:23S rRNA (cytosine1962-C5)-methyltransferase